MHRAYARASLARLEVVELEPDGVLLDPHPATAIALATATLRMSNPATHRLSRWRGHTQATAGPTL
jgi:hypothetical protein